METTFTRKITSQLPDGDWSNKILIVNDSDFVRHIMTLNTSISILLFLGQATCTMVVKGQNRLNKTGYHISSVQVSSELFSYDVNSDFPFIERLKELVHRIHSAGLLKAWVKNWEDGFEKALVKVNERHLPSENENLSATFEMPIFMFYCWATSMLVFILEIIRKRSGTN